MKLNERITSLYEFLQTQDELNKIIRSDWRTVGHEDELTYNHFATQILKESSEMLDSGVNYKWWKFIDTTNFDDWNIKIEVIDILHFLFSSAILALRDEDGNIDFDSIESSAREMFIGADAVSMFNQGTDVDNFPHMIDPETKQLDYNEFIDSIIPLLSIERLKQQYPNPSVFLRVFYGVVNGYVTLFRLNTQEISAVFAAKEQLNQFRQTDGYKSGTYVKVKDGVEDNERLKPIVEQFLEDDTKTIAWVKKAVRTRFFKSTV